MVKPKLLLIINIILLIQFIGFININGQQNETSALIPIESHLSLNQGAFESDFFYSRIFVDPTREDSKTENPLFSKPTPNTANGVEVDSQNNIIMVGSTVESRFPVLNGFDSSYGGLVDGYVVKLSENGSIIWSTFLGGTNIDVPTDISIDSEDNIIITGFTESSDFPILGTLDSTLNGSRDLFVTKLSSQGALLWSTFVGGDNREGSYELGSSGKSKLTIDTNDNIVIAGRTSSQNYPISNAYQSNIEGVADVYITKMNASGSILWSTFLGGTGDEYVFDVTVNLDEDIIVTGTTTSLDDFPLGTTSSNSVEILGFISKFSALGQLEWSVLQGNTFFQTNTDHFLTSMVIDSTNQIITGAITGSIDNVITDDAYQKTKWENTHSEVYIAKYDTDGIQTYGSYFGTEGTDYLESFAIDSFDNLYLTIGRDVSEEPVPTYQGYFSHNLSIPGTDLKRPDVKKPLIAKFNSTNSLIWSTDYLSPSLLRNSEIYDSDRISDLKVDKNNRLLIVGITEHSNDLPGKDTSVVSSKTTPFLSIMKLDPLGDEDDDDLLNFKEFHSKADPNEEDTDGDGLMDGEEVHKFFTNPVTNDTDNDGLNDKYELEQSIDPLLNDTDGDGMLDGWEVLYRLDPLERLDAEIDLDKDGLSNLDEFKVGTDPKIKDTDGDGMEDGYEVEHNLNPGKDDSEGNHDRDFFSNKFEHDFQNLGLNPDSILDSVIILLVGISLVVSAVYLFRRSRTRKTIAVQEGFSSFQEKQMVNKRGFNSLDELNEAQNRGFLTQQAKATVNTSGNKSVEDMVAGWNLQILEINALLKSTSLVEIEVKVKSTSTPIELNHLEIEYAPKTKEFEGLMLAINKSIELQNNLFNLDLLDNELPFLNLDKNKLHDLTTLTSKVQQELEIKSNDLHQLFNDRKTWFTPWQPLLTLIQMTPDGIPIDLPRIAEVIQSPKQQAEDLLQLLLDDNPMVGAYERTEQVYTKGADVSNYLETMLAKMATFEES